MVAAPQKQLPVIIESLVRGEDPPIASLAAFSDLGRVEVALVRSAWPEIPLESRQKIIECALDLAEDSVELDFTQVALVALDDESAEVRTRAAASLWESPLREVASRLLVTLDDDDDPGVRAAAASSLRQFVVLREFEQFDEELGDRVTDALRAVQESSDSAPALRACALESLGVRSLPWVSALIVAGYNDDERSVRLASVVAMGDSADERWLDYLVEQLYSDDPEFRFAAVLSLGQVGSEEAVEPLATLLGDIDPEVVIAAITALGEVGTTDAVDAIDAFAVDAPPEFAEAIADAREVAAETGTGPLRRDTSEDYDDE
ncbi:MAG: HEAT repeat domain-containing protein [Anaerolineaceae bacterium]